MTVKTHVAILCGGQSSEHEVSVNSAANIFRALDASKFTASIVGIDQAGAWHRLDPEAFRQHYGLGTVETQAKLSQHLSLQLGQRPAWPDLADVDVVFPVLHGPYGEDGTIQGLLKLARIPFVGSDVLASAVSMDKDIMKRLARDAGLPIVDFQVFHRQHTWPVFAEVVDALGLPFFVKPCNLGSSVGVYKVRHESEFLPALQDAFRLDSKIMIERAVVCREIECAVLGNEHPRASVVGEIIPHHEFYSYEAKYLDDNGASLVIPAELPVEVTQAVQAYAIKAFQTFDCSGLARVDFFIDQKTQHIYFNEINTLPGFTAISMYPMLWQASGLDYPSLITRLIELALARSPRQGSACLLWLDIQQSLSLPSASLTQG